MKNKFVKLLLENESVIFVRVDQVAWVEVKFDGPGVSEFNVHIVGGGKILVSGQYANEMYSILLHEMNDNGS